MELTTDIPADAAKGRVVAIVGRPNVGKSAVFNRIARQRIAIVHAEAGVTRDRLMREVYWGDQRFTLIDTGGIMNIDNERIHDRIDAGIRVQAEAALVDAAVVVFVVDVQAGLSPMDQEVAAILRRAGADVLLAANKADAPEFDDAAADFAGLGFPVFPISALHGRGFDRLLEDVLHRLPPQVEEYGAGPDDLKNDLCVAIVGRPNAGKSSFVNKLLRAERVLVSDVPGTTRDSIDVPFSVEGRRYTLIDTAGARRETRIDTAVERYSRMRMEESIARADIVVLMLDATRGVGLLDKQLASLVVEHGKGCVIAVNKWDLAEEGEKEFSEKLAYDIKFMAYCPVVYMSAATGYNVDKVLAAIEHVAAQSRATLPTGILNRVLEKAYQSIGVPNKAGRPLRMYYATQVGVNPIIVRIFINDPRRLPGNYSQFIVNTLRREFGLEGVVVRLQFRKRTRPGSRAKSDDAAGARPASRPKAGKGRPAARRRPQPKA
ncbi:MAG: ribosome biogenesis GTPase Der [Kiritimatiellia bacterium]|jgi:GTP-binding protein